jgi:hypothetical protein
MNNSARITSPIVAADAGRLTPALCKAIAEALASAFLRGETIEHVLSGTRHSIELAFTANELGLTGLTLHTHNGKLAVMAVDGRMVLGLAGVDN